MTVLILLIGAGWREWRRRRLPEERSLLVPVATASVLLVVAGLALFAGGIVLFAVIAGVMLCGIAEYSTMIGLDRGYRSLLMVWSEAGLLAAAHRAIELILLMPLGLFLAATLIPIATGRVAGAHRQMSGVLFGHILVGLPMAFVVLIRSAQPWGTRLLLLVVAGAWLADTCSYVIGSKVGGPKLRPTVSPAKTWSGLIGGFFGAVVGVVIIDAALSPVTVGIVHKILLGGAIATCAIWGDLIESVVKRDFHVKDAGVALPGFGGVLDRFDSLFISIPVAYCIALGDNHFG
ncbi:phosphatidate cytidylyltransferase [Nocardia sp. CA-119907]|uniref:phosphatidate cytidylyltransferase n=1 Tax=Nocardia sp. CA-119907 TaxID=3239973 RepID=UPI003D954D5B